MKIIKFKSNIHCEDCLQAVAPYLDKEESISKWNVDYNDPNNLLSISGDDVDPQKIENLVEEAGFKAEILRIMGAGGGDI